MVNFEMKRLAVVASIVCLVVIIVASPFLRTPLSVGIELKATRRDESLGESIRDVASAVEDIHRRIEKLGKAIPHVPNQAAKKKKVPKTPLPLTNTPAKVIPRYDDSIFVSIASYRDEQCAPTIKDMYDRAKNPHGLFFGVVEQHMPTDPSCIPQEFQHCQLSEFCPSDQIQVRRIHPKDAKGPTYGRYLGMLMYRGEKYLLMIDSHNRFVSHWDHIVIQMYKGSPSKKTVLSHYPEAWNNPEDKGATNAPLDNRGTTTYLCTAKFVPNLGYPRLDGFVVSKSPKLRPQPWAAAGFLFADAKILQEIPFDPHLNYVFDGEEILYSVRMWTHGWDIYSPSENIMYHYYYRVKAKKFWGLLPADWTTHRDRAHRRIQWYLAIPKPGTHGKERMVPIDTKEEWVTKDREKYGLGKERTLEEWYKFSGVDPVNQKIENKWCSKH